MKELFKEVSSLINVSQWVSIIGILIGAMVLTRVLRWLINKSFVTASEKIKVDATRYRFFKNATSLIVWVLAIGAMISMIPSLKSVAITLFAGAGIFMAIVGFAAQEAFSNIISGIFIVMFRPFRVGDMIQVTGFDYGIVDDITLRHTVILTFENKRLIIPNSTMGSEAIVNDTITDTRVCKYIEVGISYDSDVALATKLIHDIAVGHPLCVDNRSPKEKESGEPIVVVRFVSFGDFSLNLRACVWIDDPLTGRTVHSQINTAIKLAFEEHGVEIPFPYRTVVYKNDLAPNKRLKPNNEEGK